MIKEKDRELGKALLDGKKFNRFTMDDELKRYAKGLSKRQIKKRPMKEVID